MTKVAMTNAQRQAKRKAEQLKLGRRIRTIYLTDKEFSNVKKYVDQIRKDEKQEDLKL